MSEKPDRICINCDRKEPVQRKFGVTWHCVDEPTHMDVTYFAIRKGGIGEKHELCPHKSLA